uniref:Transthyretin-like family protein n=1 Tax=Rhabditophanes sp. KR3021 TaxID=114890 RepID=A0AC35U469_9BILA
MKLIISLIFLLTLAYECHSYAQSITIIGQTICDRKRAINVKVELREKDTFDPDDDLDQTVTDFEGKFRISGTEDEIKAIKPYVNFYHSCNVPKDGCTRITKYLFEKADIGKVIDMNYINLNIKGHEDTLNCP